MMILDFPIEDVHGNLYENAVVVINTISISENSNWSLKSDIQNGVVEYTEINPMNNKNISYQGYLFKDVEALTTNKKPMLLRDLTGNDWFTFQSSEVPEDKEGRVALVENHAKTTIIEQLRVRESV